MCWWVGVEGRLFREEVRKKGVGYGRNEEIRDDDGGMEKVRMNDGH